MEVLNAMYDIELDNNNGLYRHYSAFNKNN